MLALAALATSPPSAASAPAEGLVVTRELPGGGGGLWRLQSDGSDFRPLGPQLRGSRYFWPESGASSPAWSPDGSHVAFVRTVPLEPAGQRRDLWVMRADGSGLRRLTDDEAWEQRPAWAPDGSRVAFLVSRVEELEGYVTTVESVATDGSDRRALVEVPVADDPALRWLPDGTRLLFTSTSYRGRARPRPSIWSVGVDGTGSERLVEDASEPAVSPDGRLLAFTRRGGGLGRTCHSASGCVPNGELWVAAADGTGARRLTRTALDEHDPAWSPDGTRIAFVSANRLDRELEVMNADGSCRRLLVRDPFAAESRPDWRGAGPGPLRCVPGTPPPAPRSVRTRLERGPGWFDVGQLRRVRTMPVYWLGERHGRLRLSLAHDNLFGIGLHYAACVRHDDPRCTGRLELSLVPACRGTLPQQTASGRIRIRQRGTLRGVPWIRVQHRFVLFARGVSVVVGRDATTFRRVVAALRPLNATARVLPGGRLPAPDPAVLHGRKGCRG